MAGPRPDAGIAALDLRIAQAEQRLLARQRDIRQRWHQLSQGVQQAVRPQRLLVPLLGAGLAGFIAWWVRLGLAPAATQATRQAVKAEHGQGGGLAWSELLLIAWPLLPSRWRARISPTTAIGLIGLALPLVGELMRRDRRAAPPATVAGVDLARYAGTWFEIARLPARNTPVQSTSTYTLRGDGAGFDVLERCPTGGGRERVVRGVGHVMPGSGGAKLRVSLRPAWLRWLPLAWADQWILHLDRDYSVALVGDPARRALKVLAREPALPAAGLQALVALARDEGYAVDRLQLVVPGPA